MFYVTTPIYYVNDSPHIGHAYTSIAADVLARFGRLSGHKVQFTTGTDEHGQKVEKAAEKNGLSPQAFVDEVSGRFRDLFDQLNLSHDDFIRTTEPRHIKAAQALWQRLEERGQIYKGSYAGWYAVRDEAYYQEKELVNGKAPTGAPVEWVEEPSYFFKLSAWEDKLLDYYKTHKDFIGPQSRRNEVISFVKGGLKDLSISRSTFSWGIPVPGDEDHVMYVWIEALTNYLTSIGYPDEAQIVGDHTLWSNALHLVGKDILRFHAVYWPAFLMAAELPLPHRVFAHGWWTNEGEKISKAVGNVIDPLELIQDYGLDPIRYFLLREIPFGADGDFSKAALIRRINSDLANDLGNLVQRVLSFVAKNAEGQIPDSGEKEALPSQDKALLQTAREILTAMESAFEVQALHKMCEHVWHLIGEANRYMDSEAPWTLRKENKIERMHQVLYVLAETIRYIGILVQPMMPTSAGRILDQLSVRLNQRTFADLAAHPLVAGTKLPKPEGIFPRIQADSAA